MWVIELLVILLNPIPKLQHAPLPPKCYEPKSVPQLLIFPLFFTSDSHWSQSRSLGARHYLFEINQFIKGLKQILFVGDLTIDY
jgi:hypothetical protein